MSERVVIADVSIRLGLASDVASIADMSREEIEYGLPWSWVPDRVARAVRDPETNVIVAEQGGTLVGFGIMSYRGEEAHLLLFAVRASHRRQGVGSAMLAWLEAVARAAGSLRILVEARWDNAAGRNFYGELGYHETALGKAMYSGRVDGVRLEKSLRAR